MFPCVTFLSKGLYKKAAASQHKFRFSNDTKRSYSLTVNARETEMGLTRSFNILAVGVAFLFVAAMLFI